MTINNYYRACLTLLLALTTLSVARATELWTIDQLKDNLHKNTIKELTIGPDKLSGAFIADGKSDEFVVRAKYDELPSELILQIMNHHVVVHTEKTSGYLSDDLILLGGAAAFGLLLAILFVAILIYRKLPSKKEGS